MMLKENPTGDKPRGNTEGWDLQGKGLPGLSVCDPFLLTFFSSPSCSSCRWLLFSLSLRRELLWWWGSPVGGDTLRPWGSTQV